MLARKTLTVQDAAGNLVPEVTLTVRRETAGQPLAAIFSDRAGTMQLANPVVLPQTNNGVAFHVAGGAYRIDVSAPSIGTVTHRYVGIGTASETDAVAQSEGDVTGPDDSVAGQLAAFSDTTGKDIAGADLGDSPPTPAVIGSDAGVRASTPGDVIHAGHLESASALVALVDAATVALDWSSGVNFSLQITANRTLGNPSNPVAGQWRTIRLTSDAGPDMLSFGNQFFGPAVDSPPEPEASVTEYLLSVYCATTSHFIVTAISVDVS